MIRSPAPRRQRPGGDVLPVEGNGAAGKRRKVRDGAHERFLAVALHPGDADDLARANDQPDAMKRRALAVGGRRDGGHRQDRRPAGKAGLAGCRLGQRPAFADQRIPILARACRIADDQRGEALGAKIRRRHRSLDAPAAAQDGDRVGDTQYLTNLVQNEDDRNAALLQPPHAGEQCLDAGRRQHRRGLVQDQHLCVGDQGARDLDALLGFNRQVANAPRRIHLDVEAGQMRSPFVGKTLARIEAAASRRPEFHGLDDREGRRQGEALMHQFHAGRAAVADMAGADGLPGDLHRAGRGPHQPGRDAGEGRLAGAVLADHGVDESRCELDRDARQCRDVAVADGDVAACEGRRGLAGHEQISGMRQRSPAPRPGNAGTIRRPPVRASC